MDKFKPEKPAQEVKPKAPAKATPQPPAEPGHRKRFDQLLNDVVLGVPPPKR